MRIRFKQEQIQRWRVVPAAITIRIGNVSSTGIDFSKCSKALVYETFEEGLSSSTVDRDKFITLMDKARDIVTRNNRQLQVNIGEMLRTYGKSA